MALVVEVSDTAQPKDRGLVSTYAVGGIPVYWLIDIPDRRIEVYDGLIAPKDGAAACYGRCTPYGPDAEVPVVLDGREVGTIRARDLLP